MPEKRHPGAREVIKCPCPVVPTLAEEPRDNHTLQGLESCVCFRLCIEKLAGDYFFLLFVLFLSFQDNVLGKEPFWKEAADPELGKGWK